MLSDGREVVLLADRGWKGVPVSWLTVENVEHHVYNVLLPDWADVDHPLPPELAKVEAVGGAQDWEMLSDGLLAFGVTTTPQLLCTCRVSSISALAFSLTSKNLPSWAGSPQR